MLTTITSVALAITATFVSAFLALLSYGYHRRQAIRLWEREKRLPDATRLENLKFLVEQLQAEHDELKDGVHDAREVLDEAQRQRDWMEAAKEDIARLEQEKLEVVRIQNELETKQVELAAVQEQIAEKQSELSERNEQIDELRSEQSTLLREVAAMRAEFNRAEEIRAELSLLEQQKKDLSAEIESLESNARKLRDQLEDELRSIKRECTDLESQREQHRSKVNELVKQIAELNAEVQNLLTERAKLASVADELKEVVRKAEAARDEVRQMEQKKVELNAETERLESNARKLREQLESELRGLKRDCSELESQRDQRKSKLDELEKQIDGLSRKQEELSKERRELEKKVQELEGQAASLKGQIPTLQTTFDQLTSAMQQSSDAPDARKSELWHPVLSKGTSGSANAQDERECLSDVQHELKSRGLKFDQRTVFAFHTALKTTSSSPLVTLAGVSGTGKSELPRRYADAVGMNFLNVAVQPRWDSPQDLFGFYDYLERRFRPTELTRALLQVDPIGPEQGRGWHASKEFDASRCHEQMLLVLMDEMNLARVEYYFSEFLSKLETRRGINPRNELERQRAEIVLEVSGKQVGGMPLRLFVDTNVLFVGTMNEDESTQALSDKVIDRSNILRFGSPNSIYPVSSTNGNGRDSNLRQKLNRKNWDTWCRPPESLSTAETDQLLKWISQLRTSLDRVGRPFAYRVAHAMLEYAANYPEVENRIAWAVSDQIEQRILPKLIGLDMQHPGVDEALRAITKILEEVNDEGLSTKINANRRDDYFQWTGLDRTVV